MGKTIRIEDKEFSVFIPYEKIRSVIEQIADQMNHDLQGSNPIFICVLNGAFMFASEIFKRIAISEAEISFIKLASYNGTKSSGNIRQLIGLDEDLSGRTVVILEDIVDTGITITDTVNQVKEKNASKVIVATMLFKPDAILQEVNLDYVGINIPNEFIVGYGLDYNGKGRNLIDIYKIVNQ